MGLWVSTPSSQYPTNDFELVIRTSKELEWLLETRFHAEGKGLHEKISSVSAYLPDSLVRKMRFLATIRNKLIHDRDFNEIPDRPSFVGKFEEAKRELAVLFEKMKKTTDPAPPQASSCIIA